MPDNRGKTVIQKASPSVPLGVWAASGVAFLAIMLYAHFLPPRSEAEAVRFFNIERLDRFSHGGSRHPLRVVVVGPSHTLCALYFDENMEQFARQNGLSDLQFVRFVKLDGTLRDFTPVLEPIVRADPDIVFFDSNLFVFNFRHHAVAGQNRRLFNKDDDSDDRKKLLALAQDAIGNRKGMKKKPNPNVLTSEEESFRNISMRQADEDFDRYRDQADMGIRLQTFDIPPHYRAFIDTLRRRGTPVVLLQIPASRDAISVYPVDLLVGADALVARYQQELGLGYLEFPRRLGLEYYKDFVHMNERGRELYSRWFLSELPALVRKDRPS